MFSIGFLELFELRRGFLYKAIFGFIWYQEHEMKDPIRRESAIIRKEKKRRVQIPGKGPFIGRDYNNQDKKKI